MLQESLTLAAIYPVGDGQVREYSVDFDSISIRLFIGITFSWILEGRHRADCTLVACNFRVYSCLR